MTKQSPTPWLRLTHSGLRLFFPPPNFHIKFTPLLVANVFCWVVTSTLLLRICCIMYPLLCRIKVLKLKAWEEGLQTIGKYVKVLKYENSALYRWVLVDVGSYERYHFSILLPKTTTVRTTSTSKTTTGAMPITNGSTNGSARSTKRITTTLWKIENRRFDFDDPMKEIEDSILTIQWKKSKFRSSRSNERNRRVDLDNSMKKMEDSMIFLMRSNIRPKIECPCTKVYFSKNIFFNWVLFSLHSH